MRFGQYYIKVVNPNKKEKEEGRTVEYLMFESRREAEAALSNVQNKYINDPNAAVSPVAKTTIKELKEAVRDKAIGVLDLAPYLSESNAVTFNALMKEVELLIKEGVPEQNIRFVNIITCHQGIANLKFLYPDVRVFTAVIDPHLNDKKYIEPGLGDFGDRYFNTC